MNKVWIWTNSEHCMNFVSKLDQRTNKEWSRKISWMQPLSHYVLPQPWTKLEQSLNLNNIWTNFEYNLDMNMFRTIDECSPLNDIDWPPPWTKIEQTLPLQYGLQKMWTTVEQKGNKVQIFPQKPEHNVNKVWIWT